MGRAGTVGFRVTWERNPQSRTRRQCIRLANFRLAIQRIMQLTLIQCWSAVFEKIQLGQFGLQFLGRGSGETLGHLVQQQPGKLNAGPSQDGSKIIGRDILADLLTAAFANSGERIFGLAIRKCRTSYKWLPDLRSTERRSSSVFSISSARHLRAKASSPNGSDSAGNRNSCFVSSTAPRFLAARW